MSWLVFLTEEPALLDIALVLALVGFLATVALARFAERGATSNLDLEGSDQ